MKSTILEIIKLMHVKDTKKNTSYECKYGKEDRAHGSLTVQCLSAYQIISEIEIVLCDYVNYHNEYIIKNNHGNEMETNEL